MNVPLYVPESWDSVGNLIKHSTAIGMGGWWLGGVHMKPNQSFMAEVQDKVPKDAKVIVACQKGLRFEPPHRLPIDFLLEAVTLLPSFCYDLSSLGLFFRSSSWGCSALSVECQVSNHQPVWRGWGD